MPNAFAAITLGFSERLKPEPPYPVVAAFRSRLWADPYYTAQFFSTVQITVFCFQLPKLLQCQLHTVFTGGLAVHVAYTWNLRETRRGRNALSPHTTVSHGGRVETLIYYTILKLRARSLSYREPLSSSSSLSAPLSLFQCTPCR